MPTFRGLAALRTEVEERRTAIDARLEHFRRVGRGSDDALFEELCFCILAVQSSARSSDAAVRLLADGGLLRSGTAADLAEALRHRTRFHNHKAAYIVAARHRFLGEGAPGLRRTLDSLGSPPQIRAWMAAEIDGFGLKEASHFLRNIGRGEDLAILDRHILRNLVRHRAIARMPSSLTPRRYLDIEMRAAGLADALGISLGVLDLVLWSRETGEIFK